MKRAIYLLLLLVLFGAQTALADSRSFDGVDDKQTITDPNVGSTAWTLCLWFRDDSFTESHSIVSYGTGAAQGFAIHEQDDTGTIRFRAFAPGTEFADFVVGEGAWHHLCLAKTSGSSVKWYLDATNATADQTDAFDPFDPISTDDFLVAAPPPSDPAGNVLGAFRTAHIAYWSTELTGSEIASIADKTTCPTDVQSGSLEIFITEIDGDTTDQSSNGFTVAEVGSPGNDTDPGGLPCAAGPTPTPTPSVLYFPVLKAVGGI